MGILDIFGRKQREREQIELEYLRERNEIRLDSERKKKDMDLRLKEKRQELDEKLLDYKIRDAEARIDEEFSDQPEGDGSEEDQILKTFAPMITGLTKGNSPHTVAALQQPVQSPTVELSKAATLTFTDDEIEEIYKTLPPEYKKIARSAPDPLIRKFVLDRYPAIAEECLNRMILRVKR